MSYFAGLWNALALPVIAVPLGLSARDNLPVGVQIVAAPDQERVSILVHDSFQNAFLAPHSSCSGFGRGLRRLGASKEKTTISFLINSITYI